MSSLLSNPLRALKRAQPPKFRYAFPEERDEERPLAPCPDTPNCVGSLEKDERHAVDPMSYSVSLSEAVEAIKAAVGGLRGARLIAQGGHRLRFEFRSRLFGFVDDVDFWLDESNKLVHVRSASRTGRYDFGVNRKRVERLRAVLEGPLHGEVPEDSEPSDEG